MASEDPFDVLVYVLKSDESLGPFRMEEILEGLEDGRFDLSDVCLREGAIETERIRDVLDWEESTTDQEPESANDVVEGDRESSPEEDMPEDLEETTRPREILYAGHPSILNYPLSIASVVGGVVGAVWLFPIDLRFSTLCLVLCGAGLSYLTFIRFTRDYLISPKRVEVISGLIAKSSNEIRISDIRAINVTCKGLLGMFGIGTVDFFTTGDDPEVRFEKVWAAKDIKQLVRRIQDQ